MIHDPLLGVSDPNALRGIAARLRQTLGEPADAHRAMLALADRMGVATLHEMVTPPGTPRQQYQTRVPPDRAERLRAIAEAYHAAVIAPVLEAAEELEALARDVKPERVA